MALKSHDAYTVFFHLSRSWASDAACSMLETLLYMSFRITSFHLIWGVSTCLLPSISAFKIFYTRLSSPISWTSPNHFNLARSSFREPRDLQNLPLISAFLTKSPHHILTLLLNLRISNTSKLIYYVCVSTQDVAPYIGTDKTRALKIFIFTFKLISFLPLELRLSIQNALIAPVLLL